MRHLNTRILLAASFIAVGCFLGGAASAQPASEAPPTATAPPPSATPVPATPAPTEPPATPAPTPAPTPSAPPTTPKPTDAAAASPSPTPTPMITPWAWPFPWMEEALAEDEATAAAEDASGPEGAVEGSPAPGIDGAAQAGHPSYLTARRGGTLDERLEAAPLPVDEGSTSESKDTSSDSSAPASPTPPPPVDAVLTTGTTIQQHCEVQAVEHGLEGDGGSIMQVSVRHEDCTWGGTQVLVAYDIRGPPGIDVIVQTANMSIDVEVYMRRTGLEMAVGQVNEDGTLTPFFSPGSSPANPLAIDPAASSTQGGDNLVEVDQGALSGTGDAVSGSQEVSVFVEGDARWVNVLAQNAAAGATATSGDAVSSNDVVGTAGPGASGPDAEAQVGQIGDNVVELDQDAQAVSGDALAGAQLLDVEITGSVTDLTVLASNSAAGAVATSGDAISANDATGVAGPVAQNGDGPAQAGQIGDNVVDIDQHAIAHTGDALAGAQVIGIVVGGSVGELAVLAQNDATDAEARSGDAIAANAATAFAGPQALATDGDAVSAQAGDNHVTIGQFAEALSGRAVAGAQLIAIEIGGSLGNGAVQPTNSASGATAVSGEAIASNDASGSLGPVADGTGVALAQQSGDNDLLLDQAVAPVTGDAVAGSQVVALLEADVSDARLVAGRLSPAA